MRKIRVLIVDDAVVIRKILAETLATDPIVEIAGTAPNGRLALQKIPQVNPDLVTLDVEMPEMDGLATLREIRKVYPKLPVIMFSTLTARGAAATLDALSAGASDYVTKPANVGSVVAAMQNVRDQMLPKMKALCPWAKDAAQNPGGPHLPPRKSLTRTTAGSGRPTAPIEVLAIGVSTGGPAALSQFFSQLPADFPVPIVVVQHMPAIFTKQLADRLDRVGPLAVSEAEPGCILQPGEAWVARGDYHLTLRKQGLNVALELNQAPPENSCRPAVDVLFRSVAEVYKAHACGAIFTGMGYDGLRGSQFVRDAGGYVFAQDEASSVVWGMPGAVVEAGLADSIQTLSRMAPEIDKLIRSSRNYRPVVTA